MRIKKISCDKVVVQLTNSDLEHFDLDMENRPQSDIHKFLFKVMELVKDETGFDPYHGGQVMVEASPSESGMVLVISKIPLGKKKMSEDEFSKIKSIKVKETPKTRPYKKTVFIFEFYQDLENAMVMIPDSVLSLMTLRRGDGRYALVTESNVETNLRHLICEHTSKWGRYSPKLCYVTENWDEIMSGDELVTMAMNVR